MGWRIFESEHGYCRIHTITRYLQYIWVEPKFMGHGSKLLKQVEAEYSFLYLNALDEAVPFWNKRKGYRRCCFNWFIYLKVLQ